MKTLMFAAAMAASLVSFGARMIECGPETLMRNPMEIRNVTAASAQATGTVSVSNRIDLSYSTNAVTVTVSTNGWIVGIGTNAVPVIGTNRVERNVRVERHVDVPVCELSLQGGYATTNLTGVYVGTGDRLMVGGSGARVTVYGE